MRKTWEDLDDDQRALLLAWRDMTETEREQLWWWITFLQPGPIAAKRVN